QYDEFVDRFIQAVKRRWPKVLLQFEDFAQPNAMPLLQRYRHEICCFNDDIQGTASVTVGTLLAACRYKKIPLSSQRIVFLGAGSAGCGIAEHIISQMCAEGLTVAQARRQVFMVDRYGLLTNQTTGLRDFQQRLCQDDSVLAEWEFSGLYPGLEEVINQVKPGILIGVSGQPGLF